MIESSSAQPQSVKVIELDDYRPVWRCCRERCLACDNTCIAVVHMEADLDHLQCAHCMTMSSVVTHFIVRDEDGEDAWAPRVVEDLSGNVVPICHS